jgi:hypothetical protein
MDSTINERVGADQLHVSTHEERKGGIDVRNKKLTAN